MLYFAYGSNLNRRAMARRCPQARPVIAAHLHGYRLVFRRYADLAADTIGIIGGGLYEATPACLHALDRYEDAPKLYRRITVDVETVGGPREAMTYVIAGDAPTILPPDLNY